jgi:hypothetical protein
MARASFQKKRHSNRFKQREQLAVSIRRGFAWIALWQFAAFMILLLLVWANEVIDFAALFFGGDPAPPSLVRGCLSSAGVLLAAVISVGHTYIQQRNIISGLLTICCYCHKIQVDEAVWQKVEEYIGRHSLVSFSHGVCPACYEKVKSSLAGHPPPGKTSGSAPHPA